MSVLWQQIHPGDSVRGADQRVWQVVERTPGPRWVLGGDHDNFRLRHGEREVSTTRKLTDASPIVTPADHCAEAVAWQALSDNGFQLSMIGEFMSQTATADAFSSPAAAPGDGVQRDRWGRYLLPDPETGKEKAWTRVTTIARTLADEYGLNQWAKRMVAKGMSMRPDLVAGAAAADPDEDKKTLESIVKQAEDAAGSRKGANMGNAFHQAAQRHDRGVALREMNLPETLAADVTAYADTLKAAGLSVLPDYMERIVCLPDIGVAGTLDRIVRQPAGVSKSAALSVLDLKSAKSLDYSWLEIAIQQALYAHAAFMWDKAKQCWEPMPPVDQHRALVAWSPIGKGQTQIFGVDLIKGWAHAQLALHVRSARKETLSWLVNVPVDGPEVALHKVCGAQSNQDLARLWDQYHPRGLWTAEVNAAAAKRWEEINSQPQ